MIYRPPDRPVRAQSDATNRELAAWLVGLAMLAAVVLSLAHVPGQPEVKPPATEVAGLTQTLLADVPVNPTQGAPGWLTATVGTTGLGAPFPFGTPTLDPMAGGLQFPAPTAPSLFATPAVVPLFPELPTPAPFPTYPYPAPTTPTAILLPTPTQTPIPPTATYTPTVEPTAAAQTATAQARITGTLTPTPDTGTASPTVTATRSPYP